MQLADDDRLVDHWIDMPEWGAERRLWSFYLTFDGQDAIHERVALLQDRLRGIPLLDLVLRPWLHVTLLGVAFVDEITDATFDALVAATTDLVATEAPIGLRATGYRPTHDALLMPVASDRPLAPLRDRLQAMAGRVVDRPLYRLPEPLGGFDPHVTIAYARAGTWPLSRIAERFQGGDPPPIDVRVAALSLVRLRRGTDRWTWDREIAFPFGGAA